MTTEEILKLAETCGITPNKYEVCVTWKDEILKFARCLLDYGFSEGHKDGYAEGVNDERMYPENSWSDL